MGYQRRVHGGRSNPVSPETPSKSRTPSSTKIRMASRLPILLLLCLIPLLASALGEEERSHEVDASSAELEASVVKREARNCKGNRCRKKKVGKKGKKGRGKDKGKKRNKNKNKGQRKTRTKKNKTENKNKTKNKNKENKDDKKKKKK